MGLPAESEGCHSDYYTEYYEDCNSDNGSNHSNSDDDDNDNDVDNDNGNGDDNDEDNDDVIDGEEANREHNAQLNDTEDRSYNVPVFSSPTAAFTVENIKKPLTAADYRYLHYPTLRIRTVKRALSLCGHQIVGDGGAVKSAKGLFACIVSVTISGMSPDPQSPLLTSEGEKEKDEKEKDVRLERLHGLSVSTPTVSRTSSTSRTSRTFSVEDPKKFSKLMIKEQELWESAQRRDSEVMMAWQALSLQPSANVLHDNDIESLALQESSQNYDYYGGPGIDETNAKFKGNESDLIVEKSTHSNSNSNAATRFKSFEDMKDAMASGMPVEYVLGEATFCGLKFCVSNAVMVPRKSSEVLVLEAVKILLNNMILEGKDECENEYENVRENENGNEDENERTAFEVVPGIKQKRVRVLDIGTGSGCLLLSCLNNLRIALNDGLKGNAEARNKDTQIKIDVDSKFIIEGVGIDLSESALQVANTNAITLNLQDSTLFKIQDFAHLEDLVPVIDRTHTADSSPLTGPCSLNGSGGDMTVTNVESRVQDPLFSITEKWLGPYDIVLCNPPYSSKRDTTRLSMACREHEPSLALFSPDGPLSAYRTLAASLTACEAKRMHFIAVEPTGIPLGTGTGIPLGPGTGTGIFNLKAHLFLEVGHGQALPVQKIFNKLQFMTFIGVARDHKDIDRCLMYRYNGM
jgi:methylase of polypeptide subunit release factors